MKKIYLLLFLFLQLQITLYATHNRGGEITYRHIQGYEYEIKIVTYTKASSVTADRPSLDSVYLGDGSIVTVFRLHEMFIANDIKVNTYVATHIYAGQGIYRIHFADPNRDDLILNMIGSVNVPMYLEAELVVFNASLYCVNNSIVFDTVPVFFGQLNRPFVHNLTARDPDHDSLSYELIPCLMANGVPAPGYSLPNNFSISPISGQIKWNTVSGDPQGEFNFAVRINEWRKGYRVGYVMREFQITMMATFTDTLNLFSPLPLSIDGSGNYFASVNPGDTVNVHAVYFQSNISNPPVSSYGEAFQMSNPPAVQYSTGTGTAIADFSWITDSSKSRLYPYVFQLRGTSTSQRQSDLTFLVYVNGISSNTCPPFPFVGVSDLQEDKIEINIFPNPATNELSVTGFSFSEKAEINIYNTLGEKIISREIAAGEKEVKLNVKNFASGIYVVKVSAGEKMFVKKVVKE